AQRSFHAPTRRAGHPAYVHAATALACQRPCAAQERRRITPPPLHDRLPCTVPAVTCKRSFTVPRLPLPPRPFVQAHVTPPPVFVLHLGAVRFAPRGRPRVRRR